jgi:hypothetical protein
VFCEKISWSRRLLPERNQREAEGCLIGFLANRASVDRFEESYEAEKHYEKRRIEGMHFRQGWEASRWDGYANIEGENMVVL